MFISEETLELVQSIAHILIERNELLAVSESCCGGLIASYLVSVPGASRFFVGGTTTYSLRSRLHLSGWSEKDVENYTGPSEDVALRLARNLKLELGATYSLAETGWAGPDDGPDTGLAFLAVSGTNRNYTTQISTGLDERTSNMEKFAHAALHYLLQVLAEESKLDD